MTITPLAPPEYDTDEKVIDLIHRANMGEPEAKRILAEWRKKLWDEEIAFTASLPEDFDAVP